MTWDSHSLFVRGERIFLYSGEFHPWRLPVPDLWTDVLLKIKALGYNGVSFYVDWALLEGSPGDFEAEGVFAYEPFFEAAREVGLYLIARPGPYSKMLGCFLLLSPLRLRMLTSGFCGSQC